MTVVFEKIYMKQSNVTNIYVKILFLY